MIIPKEQYELILKPDGDIEIWEKTENARKCVAHKSWDMGEDLKNNLNRMYDVKKELEDKAYKKAEIRANMEADFTFDFSNMPEIKEPERLATDKQKLLIQDICKLTHLKLPNLDKITLNEAKTFISDNIDDAKKIYAHKKQEYERQLKAYLDKTVFREYEESGEINGCCIWDIE